MRSCDGCTACCKIMQVLELDKPGNTWCKHCNIGVGCGIYDTRPKSCRGFECVWLQTQRGAKPLALELRPDTSHVVITTVHGGEDIVLNISKDHSDAHEHGAIAQLVADMLKDGITVLFKCGDKAGRL